MTQHPLVSYIKEARQFGMQDPEILKTLTDAGWHVHDIVNIVVDHIEAPISAARLIAKTEEHVVISVRNLSKSYGKVRALDNVTLDVRRGSVTALLGPNGAGKTTLIRILTTLLKHDRGTATVSGFDVMRQAQRLRSVIGLAGQNAALDEILTGRENLEMVGRLYRLSRNKATQRARDLLHEFELIDAADRPVKTYSGGMRRRLDLAASLIIRPKILFLDEPTTGLDPRSRFAMWHIIRELVARGVTVLLTTQYLEEADQLAHHIFVMDHGRIIAQGTSEDLKQQVGGDIIELHFTTHTHVSQATGVVRQFGSGEPHVNPDTGVLTMPVSGGASMLADVIRQLDIASLPLSDIVLRRPSLDDVFLKLTGHEAE